MNLPEDQLLSIVETLTKRYGPDIAHDVAVAILRRRNPVLTPEIWVAAYARCLLRKERQRSSVIRSFVDYPKVEQWLTSAVPIGRFDF